MQQQVLRCAVQWAAPGALACSISPAFSVAAAAVALAASLARSTTPFSCAPRRQAVQVHYGLHNSSSCKKCVARHSCPRALDSVLRHVRCPHVVAPPSSTHDEEATWPDIVPLEGVHPQRAGGDILAGSSGGAHHCQPRRPDLTWCSFSSRSRACSSSESSPSGRSPPRPLCQCGSKWCPPGVHWTGRGPCTLWTVSSLLQRFQTKTNAKHKAAEQREGWRGRRGN